MKIDASIVINLLEQISLAAKIISYDLEHLDFILDQLIDPKHFRPLKNISQGQDRELYYHPKKDLWEERHFSTARIHHVITRQNSKSSCSNTAIGQPKETKFTKKTSLSLLPPRAKSDFYLPKHGKPVGLLFDIKLCHMKDEKYIFEKMANTDERWWLQHFKKKHLRQKSISLKMLRLILENAANEDLLLKPNELVFGLSKEALVGVFSTVDNRESRLRALLVQQRIIKKLNRTLPIFIIDRNGIRLYSILKQKEDLREAEICEDKIYTKFLLYYAAFLQTFENISFVHFQLNVLYYYDVNALSHIFSFLNAKELAHIASTSRLLRLAVDNDLIKAQYEFYIKKNNKTNFTLIDFAQSNPEIAYRVMRSHRYSKQLPLEERRVTRDDKKSLLTKIANSSIGFFLGFTIGLALTLYYTLQALLRSVIIIGTVGICGPFFQTSFIRSVLGASIFPLYSLLKSAYLGAIYGWKYGLPSLYSLMQGIRIVNHELYCGTPINSEAEDPWNCCRSVHSESTIADVQPTNIYEFFKEAHSKSIADKAIFSHSKKPISLMFPAPKILAAQELTPERQIMSNNHKASL